MSKPEQYLVDMRLKYPMLPLTFYALVPHIYGHGVFARSVEKKYLARKHEVRWFNSGEYRLTRLCKLLFWHESGLKTEESNTKCLVNGTLIHATAATGSSLCFFLFTHFNIFKVAERGAFDSAKNHKRQRHKRQSVTTKREKSQTPKFV